MFPQCKKNVKKLVSIVNNLNNVLQSSNIAKSANRYYSNIKNKCSFHMNTIGMDSCLRRNDKEK